MIKKHVDEMIQYFPKERIVGVFCYGSQNYGLNIEDSDVDTKAIVTPSFRNLAMGKEAVSRTHVMVNNEHIDIKDIRLLMNNFRKQNINYLEILFTEYKTVNSKYWSIWRQLVKNRESIARYCPYQAIKTMMGTINTKYKYLTKGTPSRLDAISVYGYDPKALCHLLMVREFIKRYIAEEPYEDCLRPSDVEFLKSVKRGHFGLKEAQKIADVAVKDAAQAVDIYMISHEKVADKKAEKLLDDVQYRIMREAMRGELEF